MPAARRREDPERPGLDALDLAAIDRWFEMTLTVEEMPMRVPGGDAR